MAGIRSTLGTTKGTGTSMPNFRVEDETEALDEISKPLPLKPSNSLKSLRAMKRFRGLENSIRASLLLRLMLEKELSFY